MNLDLALDPIPVPQSVWQNGKMPYEFALACAQGYKQVLQPYCARIEIAGGLRRLKPLVHDIELVLIEKSEGSAYQRLMAFARDRMLSSFWKKRGPRFWQFHDLQWEQGPFILHGQCHPRESGDQPSDNVIPAKAGINLAPPATIRAVPVDVFISKPQYWGWTFFLRTGSQEWNRAIMIRLKQMGYQMKDNKLLKNGQYLQFQEEADIFELLGLPFLEPHCRNTERDLIQLSYRANHTP